MIKDAKGRQFVESETVIFQWRSARETDAFHFVQPGVARHPSWRAAQRTFEQQAELPNEKRY